MTGDPPPPPTWPVEQPVLTDGRVLLRALRSDDAASVFAACQDEAIQHFTRVPVPYLVEHAEYFVAQVPEVWRTQEGATFAVVDVATEQFLGTCGLVRVDAPRREAAAGYWIAPAERGRGVAGAALTLLVEWCLDAGGLDRVTLEIEEANPASAAVAVAAGFTCVGGPVAEEMKGTERQFLTHERRRT